MPTVTIHNFKNTCIKLHVPLKESTTFQFQKGKTISLGKVEGNMLAHWEFQFKFQFYMYQTN